MPRCKWPPAVSTLYTDTAALSLSLRLSRAWLLCWLQLASLGLTSTTLTCCSLEAWQLSRQESTRLPSKSSLDLLPANTLTASTLTRSAIMCVFIRVFTGTHH